MKQPDFKRGDVVQFTWNDMVKQGEVYIVDAFGTFEQQEEPSYDVRTDEGLFKHLRESELTLVEENEKF